MRLTRASAAETPALDRLTLYPTQPLRRLAFALTVGNLLVALVLVLATLLALDANRVDDEALARDATRNMAQTVAIEVRSQLGLVDHALATIASRYQRAETEGARRRVLEDTVAEQHGLLRSMTQLRVTDESGEVILGLAAGERQLSIGDRLYFAEARKSDGVVLSKPLQSRANDRWFISLARRIVASDGRFRGVVYAPIRVDYFVQLFSPVPVGEAGTVTLRTEVLQLVARYSARDRGAIQGVGSDRVSAEFRNLYARSPLEGWYRSTPPIDRVERFFAYRKVPELPLLVIVGLATRPYLDRWHEQVWRQSLLTGFVILTIAGSSVLIFRQARRERLARREIARLAGEQSLMLENDLVGMARLRDRVILWENQALDHMFGYETGALKGQPIRQIYGDDGNYELVGEKGYEVLRAGGRFRMQLQMRKRDGQMVWMDLSAATVNDTESLWMVVDIEALKQSEQLAQHLALHDPLTGLANRRLFEERLKQALSGAARSQQGVALCGIDLDGFKPINDQYGHGAGDQVLKQVAARLNETVRANDIVARLGGDEFALVLVGVEDEHEAMQVLERCLAALREPMSIGPAQTVRIGASLGVALSTVHGHSLPTLMRLADDAMYQAKRAGKGRIVWAVAPPEG